MRQQASHLRQLLFEDKPDWFGAKFLAFVSEHPNIGLALLYLFATTIGLLFEFLLFLKFGVNILDYSETSDFVWSAVKRPQPAVGSILVILFLVCVRLLSKWALRLSWRPLKITLLIIAWPGLLRKEILVLLLIPVLLAMYSGGARFKAHDKTYFEDTIVTVITRSGHPKLIEMIPIGSVGSFLFGIQYTTAIKRARLLKSPDPVHVKAIAVHTSNVIRIEYSQISIDKIPNRDEALTRLEDLLNVPLR